MSVNKVILVGRLGKDPVIRYSPSNFCFASFSMATNITRKDKDTGEKIKETEWHQVSLSGKTAEVAQKYLKKGSQIYVEGSIKTDKWKDKNTGQDCYATKIVGYKMQMLEKRDDESEPAPTNGKPFKDEFDDDIPF